MINIPTFDTVFEEGYFSFMEKRYDKVKNSPKYKNLLPNCHSSVMSIINFLDNNKRAVIIGKPDTLLSLINKYQKELPAIKKYLERTDKKKNVRVKIDNAVKLINMLFDYPSFSKKRITKKKTTLKQKTTPYDAYSLVKKHNRRICPYCHLNHINFHSGAPGSNQFMMRPPLDHFFPESLYPWLAISLYNLIPCCEQCNSRVKLAKDPVSLKLMNPFDLNKICIGVKWDYSLPLSFIKTSEDFTFTLEGLDPHSVQHEQFFSLNLRYHWYEPEVMDLLEKFESYNSLPNSALKHMISIKEYISPFDLAEKEKRALGLFTAQFIEELIAHNEKFPHR